VATIHDEVKEMISTYLTLVHVFHAYGSVDTPWVAHALSHFTPVRYGKIASVSAAHDTTQFGDSMSCMHQYILNACSIWLNRHKRGLTPWSSEYQIRPMPFLPIQYSPFFPNCPVWSHFKTIISSIQVFNIPFMNQGIKIPKSHEWSLTLDFYRSSIH
jgi:hypothetical protein